MYKILAVFIFFGTFFAITIGRNYIYLSLIFGFLGFWKIFFSYYNHPRKIFVAPVCIVLGLIFIFFILQSFTIDCESGSIFSSFKNTFFVRIVAILIMSVLPALLIYSIYLKGSESQLISIICLAFWVQFMFWVITYISPEAKQYAYGFLGQSESVNLREDNLSLRGFGVSNEINFTSPFMMVLVCFMLLQKKILTFTTILTQLINSNMVILAVGIGLTLSKVSVLKGFLLTVLALALVWFLGDTFFARLYGELAHGGLRTINKLIADHLFILNDGLWENLFGTGRYVFQGEDTLRSDIGWVIMYNYGGIVFVSAFLAFLFVASVSAFGLSAMSIIWFFAGAILNIKGLLFGPNSYYFITFLMILNHHSHDYSYPSRVV